MLLAQIAWANHSVEHRDGFDNCFVCLHGERSEDGLICAPIFSAESIASFTPEFSVSESLGPVVPFSNYRSRASP